MKKTRISKTDAIGLARDYRNASVAIGDFRFKNWNQLTNQQRKQLEDREWDLLNSSGVLITDATGIALDEAKVTLKNLKKAVVDGTKVLANIKTAKDALRLVGALLGLSGAIASGNSGAIAETVIEVAKAVKELSSTGK